MQSIHTKQDQLNELTSAKNGLMSPDEIIQIYNQDTEGKHQRKLQKSQGPFDNVFQRN